MNHIHVRSPEQLQEAVSESFGPMAYVGAPPHISQARLAHHDLGNGMALMNAHSLPFGASPTIHLRSTAAQENTLLFGVHCLGRARVLQHERVAEVVPGSGVLYEASSAFDLEFTTDVRSLTLLFPSELLPVGGRTATERCARTLSPDWSSMRLLFGYLNELSSSVGGLSDEQRHDAGRVAVGLIGMTLRDLPVRIPEHEGAEDLVLGMMRHHVRDHLSDHRLTVAELARRHHVSVRQTYALFARIDTTPGKYLRQQRLLAARSMLSDPQHDRRPVSSVAASAGFSGLRTFERSFRREYKMTPGQWRRAQRGSELRSGELRSGESAATGTE